MKHWKKVLFIPDIHCPYHDEQALSILYSFMNWFKPDTIFIMGDLLDCYAVSRFIKDPNGALKFQQELDEAIIILNNIRKRAKNADIHLLRGNHELRIQKFLWNNAKELSNLHVLEVENLLELKRFNINYIDKGLQWFNGIMLKHGSVVRKYAGYSAKAEFEKNGCSGVSGHTHRQAIYRHTNSSDEYVWMECGHLSNPDQEYLEGEVANWQQGWGIGWFKENSKRYHLEPVPIINKKALYGGKEYY